jgi:hypothetical protein
VLVSTVLLFSLFCFILVVLGFELGLTFARQTLFLLGALQYA